MSGIESIKPDIFIASSGDAKASAIELGKQLRASDKFGRVRVWCEPDSNTFGKTITGQLVQHARECEFAVAILTKDDPALKKGVKVELPRDSVIFETGLFTGALDLSFERCFILKNIEDAGLPTDLQAILHLDWDPTNTATAAEQIAKQVANATPFERPEVPCISRQVLIYRERPKKQGGHLLDEGAKVVVSSEQPI